MLTDTFNINEDSLKKKLASLSNDEHIFICGAVDHSPQEFILPNQIYSSALIIYSQNFHKKFNDLRIRVSKWSRAGKKYRKDFIKRYISLQELPFFAYVLTANGVQIHNLCQFYINDLHLTRTIKVIEINGEKYHEYTVYEDEQFTKPIKFRLKEKISLGALHIAHFIIRSVFHFKTFCNNNGLQLIINPFQVFHDFFPSDSDKMGDIIAHLISLSQYHGYPTRVISLFHWNNVSEMPDELIADNLAGLFKNIAMKKYDPNKKESILSSNKTIISWENWS